MGPVQIKEDIYWVGALDWDIRDFHGYSTPKGTTYNAYLVMDEKITLFDGVKKHFKDDLLKRISKIVDPRRIDYLVVNHVEPDHSGSIPELVELLGPEKVICSPMGKKTLIDHYQREDWPFHVVETGQELKLGKRTVTFFETRMLHWPDSMMSYLNEDRILISSDAFGEHWATSQRFDDEVDSAELFYHASKYYANILLLYSPLVQKLMAKFAELGISPAMIAPDHGVIWRKDLGGILSAYGKWSRQESSRKALVIYDTMWEATARMAEAIGEGLKEEGVDFRLLNLKYIHRSDVMTDVLDSRAIVMGSPTLNNGMMPAVADMLTYMKGLKPHGKVGAAFGSYGWSGEAVKLISEWMREMNIGMVGDGLRVKYTPTKQDLDKCVELGRQVARAALALEAGKAPA
ncbi:MAG: flavodoxin domain-containing protein [Syntrophobacteraceae bacterium]|nr:flavodoxin domain-containing protein [Syntrophobacteraceae bacterium]